MTSNSDTASPTRGYVCLQEQELDDGTTCYIVRGEVDARNAQNAMRKAYRELVGGQEGQATLVVIPNGQWRPTVVTGTRRPDITVSIG